jgi:hypothetical protein
LTKRPVLLTLTLAVTVTLAQAGATALALGRPDLGDAAAFLAGAWPTSAAVLAALSILIWTMVLGASSWNLLRLVRQLGGLAVSDPRWRNGMALVAGLLILAGGAVHHVTGGAVMSGGSVQEAQSILGR